MTAVRIQQAGSGAWHELEVDDAGRVLCPLCRDRLPVATVVEHLQPQRYGTVRPMADDEDEPVVEVDWWRRSW